MKFGGDVVPFCAQIKTQYSVATLISADSDCMSAALQQSMSIMPFMLHSLSPKGSGTPASAPPASTSNSMRDVSRFFIVTSTLLNNPPRRLGFQSITFSFSVSNGHASASLRSFQRSSNCSWEILRCTCVESHKGHRAIQFASPVSGWHGVADISIFKIHCGVNHSKWRASVRWHTFGGLFVSSPPHIEPPLPTPSARTVSRSRKASCEAAPVMLEA